MSAATVPGSIKFSRITRPTEVNGVVGPGAFVLVDVYTPNGVMRVEVDAGEFSRALAYPGVRSPATLSSLPSTENAA